MKQSVISKLLLRFLIILYLGILLILPFQWYKIGPYSEIFPAFDLMIIYYFNSYKKVKNWHLFIAGLVIDQFYQLPIGISALSFILANYGLIWIRRYFILKDYYTHLIIFPVYSLFIIFMRYLFVSISNSSGIEGVAIYFYFLTTIISYPVMYIAIDRPIKILKLL